jgi:hypothetical protein
MADYNPTRRDGLQDYINRQRGRDAYGWPIDSFIDDEKPARFPTQFEEDVRIIYDELMSILLRKHKDYGPKNIAEAPGGALNGLRVRIHDKLARINNLIDNGSNQPEYEALEDSFADMANYAIIGMLVLRDKWDK